VKEIINDGKMEDALQLVMDIERLENLTPEETLRTLYHKADLYSALGQYEIGLNFVEELYQKSQEMNMPFFSLDALYIKEWWILLSLGRVQELYKTLKQHEKLFNSLPREDSPEYQVRESILLLMKGAGNQYKGKNNLALEDHEKCLALFKKITPHSSFLYGILSYSPYCWMAYTYTMKGELTLALECAEKTLSLIPEGEYYSKMKGDSYRVMGYIYFQKGELDKALEYQTRALNTYKNTKEEWFGSWSYVAIIDILLAKKDLTQARNYLEEFNKYTEKHGSKYTVLTYQLSHARVLRSGSIMRDRVEAENILKSIIKEPAPNIRGAALIDLCKWYFEEFQLTNQIELLDDIQRFVNVFQISATRSNSFSLLANVKLFQAKLALLQVNMVEARKLLTEAQTIADEHGLQLLAGEISREHDRLLEELKLWESIKNTKASVSERLKLASIDDVMDRLQGRGAVEPSEIVDEEPISLLIMDKSGVSYFNHSFVKNWDFSDLFSSFMSAFNTFSGEIFSRSIDRVMIGENTILINPIEPFLACYVIKGQSYPAQQKLTRFSDAVKASPEIWEALNRAVKTSEMLELDNPPSLGSTVNEIFV
jgi:tetratricopeptide (TPR) repeat protein